MRTAECCLNEGEIFLSKKKSPILREKDRHTWRMKYKMDKESANNALEKIEIARHGGKIKKGANEVTKAIEKGNAKIVAIASDVTPKEIVMHIPLLCKEKGIECVEVGTKDELGAAAGLAVGTTAVAVVEEGGEGQAQKTEKKSKPKKQDKN